jgi:hypothetical protein
MMKNLGKLSIDIQVGKSTGPNAQPILAFGNFKDLLLFKKIKHNH